MDKYNLLDCTLRDGGYITDWKFPDPMIRDVIQTLAFANLDFVEVGYLCDNPNRVNSTQFSSAEQLSEFLPQNRRRCKFLAMADVAQILPDAIAPHSEKSVDGIRVVFYKHQIAEALVLSKRIKEQGYQLFVQPMVTIDYTLDEFVQLTKQLADIEPDAISIVDSFGYMRKDDFRKYFKVVDNVMAPDTTIGFHLHNNMNLAFSTAQDIMEYDTHRRLIIDASLYGMGRGAGNLNTELIANHYNYMFGIKYNISSLLTLIDNYIMNIYHSRSWGYSPYMFLTGLHHYHPNFACYLLDEVNVSIVDFEDFLRTIPKIMRTKCRKPYVMEMWEKFQEARNHKHV